MCSQYTLKVKPNEIQDELDLIVPDILVDSESRYLPHSSAPVIVNDKDRLKMVPMRFSLIPSWASEPKVKFATHNARIETILEKPTWKVPFVSKHCVVPMTSFYEAVYSGPLAGNMIRFRKDIDGTLYAAGIFDFWKDPEEPKNNFFSFSILTRDPSRFILEYGHDRTPLFIHANYVKEWLSIESKPPELIKQELLDNAFHPNFNVDVDRALKPGWEKRK